MKILNIAIQKDGKLQSGSFEVITAAKELGGEITTVIGAANAEELGGELAARGGGKVLAVTHDSLSKFNDDIYAKVCSDIIGRYSPDVVLIPASNYGKALAARLAAKQGGVMASDATKVTSEGDNVIAARPSYGGSVVAHVQKAADEPMFVSVRGKVYSESKDGDGQVAAETVDPSCFESRMSIEEVRSEGGDKVTLADADIIVSAGRGLKGADNIPMVQELADSLGAAFGASRAIVDAGWVQYAHQVGQTGKTVNPKLYFAVGISGAIQHLVGMRSSGTIVAINKDKDAPIFNVANYGIVGDAFEIVPALTSKFKSELSR